MTRFSITFNRAAAASGQPRHWDIWAAKLLPTFGWNNTRFDTASSVTFNVKSWTEYDPAIAPPARIACDANQCAIDPNGHAVFS